MGLPKQEEWIHKHNSKFNQTVMMGVGGSFEVLSGAKSVPQNCFKS